MARLTHDEAIEWLARLHCFVRQGSFQLVRHVLVKLVADRVHVDHARECRTSHKKSQGQHHDKGNYGTTPALFGWLVAIARIGLSAIARACRSAHRRISDCSARIAVHRDGTHSLRNRTLVLLCVFTFIHGAYYRPFRGQQPKAHASVRNLNTT